MAANTTLSAQPREATGKGAARKLRAAGRVPAVIYGRGETTRILSVDAHELDRLIKHVHVENTIIELDIEGERGPLKTLIREVQTHAYRDEFVHVDFLQIHAGERINVEVPIRLLGTAPGVKLGGVLMHMLTDLELSCLPDQIPETIDIDISSLQIGDSVHVRDVPLGPDVEVGIDQDRAICSVAPPTVSAVAEGEEAEEAPPEERAVEPEVIRRTRAEEEEE